IVALAPGLRPGNRGEDLTAAHRAEEALDLVGRRRTADYFRCFEVHFVAHRGRRALLRDLLDDEASGQEIGAEAAVLLRKAQAQAISPRQSRGVASSISHAVVVRRGCCRAPAQRRHSRRGGWYGARARSRRRGALAPPPSRRGSRPGTRSGRGPGKALLGWAR